VASSSRHLMRRALWIAGGRNGIVFPSARIGATLTLALRPAYMDSSLSLLRIALWLILGIDVGLDHAGGRTRMVRRGFPRTFQQFHSPEFFQHDAAPVCRGTYRFQPTLTFAAILVAEYARLAYPITAQSVGTK
jgi:hypothetical protein